MGCALFPRKRAVGRAFFREKRALGRTFSARGMAQRHGAFQRKRLRRRRDGAARP